MSAPSLRTGKAGASNQATDRQAIIQRFGLEPEGDERMCGREMYIRRGEPPLRGAAGDIYRVYVVYKAQPQKPVVRLIPYGMTADGVCTKRAVGGIDVPFDELLARTDGADSDLLFVGTAPLYSPTRKSPYEKAKQSADNWSARANGAAVSFSVTAEVVTKTATLANENLVNAPALRPLVSIGLTGL